MITDVHFKPTYTGVRHSPGTFKGPASYTTGGVPVYLKDTGLANFMGATPAVGCNSSGTALYLAFFHSTLERGAFGEARGIVKGKILITALASGEEVANATDLSAIVFTGMIFHGA